MIGIYGGTFDPIHYGHLRVALEVSEILGLSELRFIPCQIPPHRNAPGASPEQRLRLLQAALHNNAPPAFIIDTRDLARPGPSYMVDTLHSIRSEAGEETPLALILGMDAFLSLPSWHQWQRLPELAHIVVMRRPGVHQHWSSASEMEFRHRCTDQTDDLYQSPSGKVYFAEVTLLDISASRVRQLINKGRSARYLTPDPVLDLIEDMKLYREDQKA